MSMEPETETPTGTAPGGARPPEEPRSEEAASGWATAAEDPSGEAEPEAPADWDAHPDEEPSHEPSHEAEAEAFPTEQPVRDDSSVSSHSEPHARQGETGEPEVDAVLESMEGLEGVPVSEHVEAFEDAHRRLHEALLSAGEESAGETHGQGP